jgi:hypothetical protein
VSIPIWKNGPMQVIDIKVRYRLVDDKLSLYLAIERVEDLVDAALDAAVFAAQKELALPVYFGSRA